MKFSSLDFLELVQEKILTWKLPTIQKIAIFKDNQGLFIKAKLKEVSDSSKAPLLLMNNEEKAVIRLIKEATYLNNKNNISRTQGYYDYFIRNKEVHWAFLAHMVSRNSGYYMTDLRSSFLKEWLPETEQNRYFLFLERSNAYIFQDAFPQLLLYEHSKKLGKPLFHLLKAFQVSSFMQPFWELFFKDKNSQALTVAMIVNEQYMLEERVIKGLYQAKSLLDELPFKLQENLGFTTIFIPYKSSKAYRFRLSGRTVKEFANVSERILIGKQLYQILFEKGWKTETLAFAKKHPHTGSRCDYWPFLFVNKKGQSEKLYSPRLVDVWGNIEHSFDINTDWFRNTKEDVLKYFEDLPEVKKYDVTKKALQYYLVLAAFDSLKE